MRPLYHLLLLVLICVPTLSTNAQSNIRYGEYFVVFEAEDTDSDMSKWTIRKPGDAAYYLGNDLEAINQGYLEYTGPWAAGKEHGSDVELMYKFTAPSTGEYRMVMRMYQPLGPDGKGDQKNDVFVRLEGNFTTATSKPTSELSTNHKFWGRGVRKWGSAHKLEIGGGHLDARYALTEGEEYTFYMSGRSNGCSIDYILFFDDTQRKNVAIHDDIAVTMPDFLPNGPDQIGPVFTSVAQADFEENSTEVAYIAVATDQSDPISYAITGGLDNENFTIDASSGEVRFKSAPNFGSPTDANQDNIYEIQITATDALEFSTVQDITITVIESSSVVLGNFDTEELQIYPNPARSTINILHGESDFFEYVAIYNTGGLLVKEVFRLDQKALDISDLNPGTYFLKIDKIGADSGSTLRFVVK
ncbi:MAG: T9SS type A sorting domain-containing protein [Bacteroidota bacterium]